MDRKLLTKAALGLGVGALMTLASLQAAQAADKARVRGTIESLDGDTLKVKTHDGKEVTVMLKSGWAVTGVVKASAADIKPGDFVGIASQATDSGVNGAIEVVVFPAAMKGTGEGDRPWDLKPNSSMTNATVANAVTSVNGPTLTLTFQGKEKKINIPDGTPVVTFGPATKDDLKAGAAVFINGDSTGDGMVSSDRVAVGTNGVIPPM
jgi:ribosome maturation factor RimP